MADNRRGGDPFDRDQGDPFAGRTPPTEPRADPASPTAPGPAQPWTGDPYGGGGWAPSPSDEPAAPSWGQNANPYQLGSAQGADPYQPDPGQGANPYQPGSAQGGPGYPGGVPGQDGTFYQGGDFSQDDGPGRARRRGFGRPGCGDVSDIGCCLLEILGDAGSCTFFPVVPLLFALVSGGRRGHDHVHGGPRGRAARRLYRAVRVYQTRVSPRRPPCCRFSPTCSAYAAEALTRHGALRGSWLTLRRLGRCRPGGSRGRDPVPA